MIKKIFLMGLPGSGKTTLGQKLASKLNIPFFDLDQIIESTQQRKVVDIFENDGESFFREVEKQALLDTINNHQTFILATGGGTPCFFDNMEIMLRNGFTLYLAPDLNVIAERLDVDETSKRPLMKGWDKQHFVTSLEEKLMSRKQFYNKAHIKIKGDESMDHISSLIINLANSKN